MWCKHPQRVERLAPLREVTPLEDERLEPSGVCLVPPGRGGNSSSLQGPLWLQVPKLLIFGGSCLPTWMVGSLIFSVRNWGKYTHGVVGNTNTKQRIPRQYHNSCWLLLQEEQIINVHTVASQGYE